MPLIRLSATGQGRRLLPAPVPASVARTSSPPSHRLPEQVFFVLAVLFYGGGKLVLSPEALDDGINLGAADPFSTAAQAVILAVSGLYALWRPSQALMLLARAWPFLLLAAYAAASALWSQDWQATLRRSAGFGTLILFALFAADRLGLRRFMRLVVWAVLAGILASLAEAVLRPAVGFDTGDYANAIRGIYGVKNSFGAAVLDGMLALGCLILHRGRMGLREIGLILLFLAMLVLARSTTSLLLTLVLAGASAGFVLVRRGGGWVGVLLLAASLGLGLATLGLAVFGLEGAFDLIGKDETLTGRTFIWDAAHAMIAERPWLGWGYSAFWIEGSRPAGLIWQYLQWPVPHAHDAFLDIALQLGWVGLGLLLAVVAISLVRTTMALDGPRWPAAAWGLVFLGVMLVYGYGEAAIYRVNLTMVFWVLLWLHVTAPAEEARG